MQTSLETTLRKYLKDQPDLIQNLTIAKDLGLDAILAAFAAASVPTLTRTEQTIDILTTREDLRRREENHVLSAPIARLNSEQLATVVEKIRALQLALREVTLNTLFVASQLNEVQFTIILLDSLKETNRSHHIVDDEKARFYYNGTPSSGHGDDETMILR
jgi:hypothetical protein